MNAYHYTAEELRQQLAYANAEAQQDLLSAEKEHEHFSGELARAEGELASLYSGTRTITGADITAAKDAVEAAKINADAAGKDVTRARKSAQEALARLNAVALAEVAAGYLEHALEGSTVVYVGKDFPPEPERNSLLVIPSTATVGRFGVHSGTLRVKGHKVVRTWRDALPTPSDRTTPDGSMPGLTLSGEWGDLILPRHSEDLGLKRTSGWQVSARPYMPAVSGEPSTADGLHAAIRRAADLRFSGQNPGSASVKRAKVTDSTVADGIRTVSVEATIEARTGKLVEEEAPVPSGTIRLTYSGVSAPGEGFNMRTVLGERSVPSTEDALAVLCALPHTYAGSLGRIVKVEDVQPDDIERGTATATVLCQAKVD